MRYVWIPEHPRIPVYRARNSTRHGKLGDVEAWMTASIHEALEFDAREACEAWCAANPRPAYVAREHGIG